MVDYKRDNYISWNEYFMLQAGLSAQRSKDPVTQVGACIVNDDNVIVGCGYNGFCRGVSDDLPLWGKGEKKFYVVHAEVNAVLNSQNADLRGHTLYVTHFPCHDCAKIIIQKGIKKIVFSKMWGEGKPTHEASKKLLEMCNVEVEFYGGTRDFTIKL